MKELKESCKANVLWHYAPWSRLHEIVKSGFLQRSNASAPKELPMLWFSANQVWEPTATKNMWLKSGQLMPLTFEAKNAKFGCIRFGIAEADPRLQKWKQACATAGILRGMRCTLERVGKKMGANPEDWHATAVNVPLNELHFQVWSSGWKDESSAKDMADAWTQLRLREPAPCCDF